MSTPDEPIGQRKRESLAANNIDGLPILAGTHLEKLWACGLTAETIREAGIWSVTDVDDIARILNRKKVPRAWGPCLVIPYYNEEGAVVFSRVRPNNPPITAKTGKSQKYIQPSGMPTRPYIPRPVRATLADARARLLITEGEFKALAATQFGFPCIALAGVECWHDRRKTTLSADLARIPWKDRDAYIVFDSDAAANKDVLRCECEFAAALAGAGAKVKVVRLPPGAEGAKVGLDDFLVAHGAAEFWKLMQHAVDPIKPDAGVFKDNASEADPAIEAAVILSTCTVGDLPRLRFWRGSWWLWANGRYAEKPTEEVRGEVANLMANRWNNVRSRYVSDVVEHLRAQAMLPSSIELPAWLTKSAPNNWPADECLATKNAIVHLPTLIELREPCQVPTSPALLTTTATEFSLDLEAPTPEAWRGFLGDLWSDDAESIATLREWFGYCLTHNTRQQKALLLVGPPRCGKGTIGRILTALVGKGNIAAPTLASLGTNFGLWPLIGKSLAIISDARLSGRADLAAVVERILTITGEDFITVDRKNLPPITLKLPTRFMILTNELPRLSDASGASVSRFITLHTTKSWLGKEDHGLEERLMAELPGILLWAIGGWQRLRERGRFLQPQSAAEVIDDMNDLASPVSAFVRDCCRVGPSETVEKEPLFAAWREWCDRQGRGQFAGTLPSFCRDVLAAVPGVRGLRLRVEGGRSNAFGGVGLRADW